jgi:predicted peroxiredoxin
LFCTFTFRSLIESFGLTNSQLLKSRRINFNATKSNKMKINGVIILGILTIFFNLLGCTGRKKSDDSKLSKEVSQQLSKSIEDFKNKPIHQILTKQNIDTTSDDNLVQLILDNLSKIKSTANKKEYETVMSWNKSKQAVYMIWLLEGEVNNGGYNQFYFNPSGQFYKHLPEMLKLVGADKFADLTKRANRTFEKENAKITQNQDGTLEGFSKSFEDNPLNKYDTEFYKLYEKESLQDIQVKYIRTHKEEFVEKKQ